MATAIPYQSLNRYKYLESQSFENNDNIYETTLGQLQQLDQSADVAPKLSNRLNEHTDFSMPTAATSGQTYTRFNVDFISPKTTLIMSN